MGRTVSSSQTAPPSRIPGRPRCSSTRGPGSSSPWLLLSPVPQWSSLTVRIARDLQRLAILPAGSTPSAAYNARKSARVDFEYMPHPTRALHSANRVGTAIASTSVTQRSAPLQNDKHPALAAAWKICMRGLSLARTSILTIVGTWTRPTCVCGINMRSCTFCKPTDAMHERARRPSCVATARATAPPIRADQSESSFCFDFASRARPTSSQRQCTSGTRCQCSVPSCRASCLPSDRTEKVLRMFVPRA
ncbi:hypothetical protein B0H13DRAFT_255527 [Mycena leptocephala]|nr:hypothetical protein B0H13DRAFT_255527 [Mycena leptocephala]